MRAPARLIRTLGVTWLPLAGLLVSGCTSDHGISSPSRGPAAGLSAGNLSPDLLTGYFPVSGAQMNQPSAIKTLYDQIQQNGYSACMKKQGYRVPGFQREGPVHAETAPDLGYIKAHGFLITGSSDVGDDLSTASVAAQQAFGNALGRCGKLAMVPLARFSAAVDLLSSRWTTISESVQGDPAVVRAYTRFVSCLHRAGINVADEDAFLAYVDGLHNERAQYQAAQIYLPCITPVETVRLPLRKSLRETFIADHQDALRAAQQAADDLARQYASAYASARAAGSP